MKQLYLLRHANAMKAFDVADNQRPLSDIGISEIRSVKQKFLSANAHIDLVLCSSAMRTTQTATELFKGSTNPPKIEFLDSLYNTNLDTYLDVLSEVADSYDAVLVVAHHPSVSELANFINTEDNATYMDTSHLLRFSIEDGHTWATLGRKSGHLVEVIIP